jgi:hypothetical protein
MEEREKAAPRLIERRELAGGMSLLLYDQSRRCAGDRLMAELACRATVPVTESMWKSKAGEDSELLNCIRERMGGELAFSLEKVRNFIPQDEKENVMEELISQMEAHMMRYLESPRFPEKLFEKRYEELREQCLLDRWREGLGEADEEDEGPSDFSFLFRS